MLNMDDNKGKALAAALAQIEKQFGKGSIMKMGEAQIQNDLHGGVHRLARARHRARRRRPAARPRRRDLRSRIVGQDDAVPAGRRAGPEGRRHRGLHRCRERARSRLCRQARRQRRRAADLAARHTASRDSRSPTCSCARAASTSSSSIRSRRSCPRRKSKARWATSCPGLQARLMSQALRKLTSNIKRANVLVIFINQIRMKIGVMFGNPETTTGGNALKFYASVRLDIRRIGSIKRGDEVVGNETRVKVVKNKVVAAVSRGAVRHPLRRRHLPRRRDHRARRQSPHRREIGCVVRVRRRQDRPGQGQRARIPARAPGDGGRNRGEDPRDGRRARCRRRIKGDGNGAAA